MDDLNKRISTAKRLWNQSKRVISRTDKIDRSENALFVNDEFLASLVVEREEKEAEIIRYIDDKLAASRPKNDVADDEVVIKFKVDIDLIKDELEARIRLAATVDDLMNIIMEYILFSVPYETR